MKLKNISAVIFCLIVLFCVTSCGAKKESVNNNTTDDIEELFDASESRGSFSDMMSQNEHTRDSSYAPNDMAAWTTDFPSFSFAFALTENELEDENYEGLREVEFSGEPIKLYFKLTAGSFSEIKIRLRVFINGTAQILLNEKDKNDKTDVTVEKNQSKTVELSFIPNIGKKGETKELSFEMVSLPDVIKGEDAAYSMVEDDSSFAGNVKLLMKVDSVGNEMSNICENSLNAKTSSVNKLIHSSCIIDTGSEVIDEYNSSLGLGIYKNIDDFMYIQEPDNVICTNYSIETKPSGSDTITLCLYGKPGRYRVGFSLNGELQPVFDGKYFADFTVEKNRQTEALISIDSSSLSKNNKVSMYATKLDEKFCEENVPVRTDPYKLLVMR